MSKKSAHPQARLDYYTEPGWCIDLLLAAEDFSSGMIWDPAAGSGTIVKRARAAGIEANGSDIVVRDTMLWEMDFLTANLHSDLGLSRIRIVCNPPYGLAEAFIRRAIGLGVVKHCWLVQRDFPYSQGRYKLFTEHPPARIWFLSSRPSCPPGELLERGEIEQKGGSVDYCWMVWEDGARKDRDWWGHADTHAGWLIRPEHSSPLPLRDDGPA